MVGQDAREHRRAGRATPYCSEEPSRATRRHPLPRPALPRPNSGAVRRTHHHHPVRSPRHLRNPRLRPGRLHLHRHQRSPPQPSSQPPRHRNSPPRPPQAAAPSDQRSHPDRCHPRRTSHSRTEQATPEAAHLRRGRVMNQAFIVTKEHRRFTEFANAVRKEKTIGICHGAAGVGKTNSARPAPANPPTREEKKTHAVRPGGVGAPETPPPPAATRTGTPSSPTSTN